MQQAVQQQAAVPFAASASYRGNHPGHDGYAAAEPMCDGASFDLRQAVLNVIPGRTLISCGG